MISVDIMILVILIAALLFGFLVFSQPDDSEEFQYLWDERMTDEEIVFRNGNQVLTYQMLEEGREEVDLEVLGREDTLEVAQHFYKKGLEAKKKGTTEKAIDLFQQVHQISSKWPAPLYELAMLYLEKEEDEFAYEAFEDIDILYPKGFKDVKAALFSLQAEKNGFFPKGTFLRFKRASDLASAKRAIKLRRLVKEVPNFAPGVLKLVQLTKDRDKRMALLQYGLEVKTDSETHEHLLIEKAILDAEEGYEYEAIHTLGMLVLNSSTTDHSKRIAKRVLFNIVR